MLKICLVSSCQLIVHCIYAIYIALYSALHLCNIYCIVWPAGDADVELQRLTMHALSLLTANDGSFVSISLPFVAQ